MRKIMFLCMICVLCISILSSCDKAVETSDETNRSTYNDVFDIIEIETQDTTVAQETQDMTVDEERNDIVFEKAEWLFEDSEIIEICNENPELYYEYLEYGELSALSRLQERNEAAFYQRFIGSKWIFSGYVTEIKADHCFLGWRNDNGYGGVIKVYLPIEELVDLEKLDEITVCGFFSMVEEQGRYSTINRICVYDAEIYGDE